MFAHWTGDAVEPNNAARRSVADWEALKARLVRDLRALRPIAETTRTTLEALGGRKGKPPDPWRNRTFAALVERLKPMLSKQTQENIASVARQAWNIYFPRHRVMEDDAALKLLQRESSSRRTKT